MRFKHSYLSVTILSGAALLPAKTALAEGAAAVSDVIVKLAISSDTKHQPDSFTVGSTQVRLTATFAA